MPASLGLDVGLSGVRAAVMDGAGSVLASASRPATPTFGEGVAEQDPVAWVEGALEAGSDAVREAGVPIDALAVTALGPAPVPLDAAGAPLAAAPLFGLDRRADPWRARLGTGPDDALPSILRWHETEPSIAANARLVLDAAGYVVRALTGAEVMDRITAASYRSPPGVASPIPVPDASEPDAVAGGLHADAAARLGLATGTPVAVGTIDCFADAAAAGVERGGEGVIVLGSTLIVYAVTAEGTTVEALDTTPHLAEGSLVGGSTATAGLALDRIVELVGGGAAELAAQAASLEPGAGGLLALPYLAGERTPVNDPAARGVLAGLTLATERVHLYRAMLDGVAVTALDHTSRLERAGIGPATYRVAGGGVRNEAWLQATCDAVGRPLEVMPDPGTAVGAAWLGLRMLGAAPSRVPDRTVQPDAGAHERYMELLTDARDLWDTAGPVVRLLS